MNKIKLAKPIAMITIGYPGAGKTALSRQAGDRLKLPVVSFERIRYELFEHPSMTKEENAIVERIFNYTCEISLKAGESIICDGNFPTLSSRKKFYKLLKEHSTTPLIVWVQTDMDTSFTRAAKRNKQKLDDKYNTEISLDEFDKQQKVFKRPAEKENYVVVSGKHAFKSQLKTILSKMSVMGMLDGASIASLQTKNTVRRKVQ